MTMGGIVKKWDVKAAVKEGVITVRELSQHTPEVLRCIEDFNRPVVVTRHGKIIASISPISMRRVVDQMIANNASIRDSLSAAEVSFAQGDARPAEYVLKDLADD